MVNVKVDSQGRLVVPSAQRRRLGVSGGGEVELVPTPEGLLLEPSREISVSEGEDGLQVATIKGAGTILNLTVLEALHSDRATR